MENGAKYDLKIKMAGLIDDVYKENKTRRMKYVYPAIPEKIIKNLIKNIDESILQDEVLAVFDETLTKNTKNAMVFTMRGFYYRGLADKAWYCNYIDCNDISVAKEFDKKGKLKSESLIIDYCGEFKKIISDNYFDMDDVSNLIIIMRAYVQQEELEIKKISGTVTEHGALDLTPDEQMKCHGIIHAASAACGGVGTGLAQLPLADTAVITPIQIGMIISLGAVFDIDISESAAKSIIIGEVGSYIGRGLTQLLFGWMPVAGNVINTATATGLTEFIGWIAVKHFYDVKHDDKVKYKYENKKEGYEEAAAEFDEKYRKQAREILKNKKMTEEQFKNYDQLIEAYNNEILSIHKQIDFLQKTITIINKKNDDKDKKIAELERRVKELEDERNGLRGLSA